MSVEEEVHQIAFCRADKVNTLFWLVNTKQYWSLIGCFRVLVWVSQEDLVQHHSRVMMKESSSPELLLVDLLMRLVSESMINYSLSMVSPVSTWIITKQWEYWRLYVQRDVYSTLLHCNLIVGGGKPDWDGGGERSHKDAASRHQHWSTESSATSQCPVSNSGSET